MRLGTLALKPLTESPVFRPPGIPDGLFSRAPWQRQYDSDAIDQPLLVDGARLVTANRKEGHVSDDAASTQGTGRLEAFSDGVMAIIVTIMVLELRPPEEPTLDGLRPLVPIFLSYVLSFTMVGIYWNNHHHLLRATTHNSGAIMWTNLYLLFWLSLVPFVTAWIGGEHAHPWPAATYGLVACMAAIAYYLLVRAILAKNHGTAIERAIGTDRKGKLSVVIYVIGAALAFVDPWLAYASYVLVAVVWFVPDRRLDRL